MSILKTAAALFTLAICWTYSIVPAAAQKAPTDKKLEKTLLWKVTGKGIKPSYVFGTIHLIAEKDFFWSPAMDKALKKSKRLVMEIDMSQQLAMAGQMMALAPMKGGETLADVMSEEDYALVKTYFTEEAESAEAKMTFNLAQTWQPMLLQSLLYKDMIEGPIKMYEMELMAKAREQDMSFGGLETIGDQMSIFHDIPYKEQAEALVDMIKDIKSENTAATDFAKLIEGYKTQDIDAMIADMGEELEEMGSNQDALVTNRNKKWIPEIAKFSKTQPTFYAVGAGHLGGEEGVIRLLRKAGYKVTPVK